MISTKLDIIFIYTVSKEKCRYYILFIFMKN